MNFYQLLQCGLLGLLILLLARRLPRFGLKRPVAFFMLIALVILVGAVSLKQLPLELMPNIAYGNVTIFIDVRGGMPPPEVERLVTKPVEEAMGTVSKLRNVISTSKKHRAIITLEFEPGTNMDLATMETREKFLRVKHQLPKEIEKPVIAHYEEADAPVLIAALTSPHVSPEALRQMVEETLKEKLLRVPGVANVEIGGGRQRKILVELDQHRLVGHNLPFHRIVTALEQNNLNVQVGELTGASVAFGLRTEGDFKTVADIQRIGVAVTERGELIRLSDIASVKDDYLEPETHSRLNRQAAVTLYVQKESLANTVAVAREAQTVLHEFEQTLSKDVTLLVVSDQARMIKAALYSVAMTLFYGMALVVLVLSLFLATTRTSRLVAASGLVLLMGLLLGLTLAGAPLEKAVILVLAMIAALLATAIWRRDLWPAFIVAASIPVSLLLSLGMMYFNHVTLNVISLSGLVLGIGLLVDNSVVVLENYVRLRHARQGGDSHALIDRAAQEMIQSIAGGTLTTIVVFLPFSLLQKQAQLLYAGIAFTVTTILLASVFTALGLIPALLGRQPVAPLSAPAARPRRRLWRQRVWAWLMSNPWLGSGAVFAGLFLVLAYPAGLSWLPAGFVALVATLLVFGLVWMGRYRIMLKRLLPHAPVVMAAALAVFALSALVFWFQVPKDFLASQEQNEFVVFVEMASGVRLEIADRIVREIEERIQNSPEVSPEIQSVSSKVEGWSSKIYVTLKPRAERHLSAAGAIAQLRRELTRIGEDYETFIHFSEPQGGKELFVEVYGHNYETLSQLAMQVANRIAKIPGLSDLKVRYRPGRPEAGVLLNRHQVALAGLTPKNVAESLHAQLKGLRATALYDQQEEVETIVRLDPAQCETISQLKQVMLMSGRDGAFPLEHISRLEFGLSPSEIWRRNKSRMIQVSANLGQRPLSEAGQEVLAAIRKVNFPDEYYADLGGDYEQMLSANRSFQLALAVTVILIFMVMACLFESLIQPLIIMVTVLLSGIGAVAALVLTQTTMTLGVSIGLLMLGGIVVNNGIMLIDCINQLKASHPHFSLAKLICRAGHQRLRPIWITAITTLCGLLPMALDQSESASLWQPLAITVIGGLLTGTVLTLFVVPSFYSLVDSWRHWFSLRRRALTQRSATHVTLPIASPP